MKFSYEELKFLSEILFSYIEDLNYSSDSDLDITEISKFEFCDNLLYKLNKKIIKNKDSIIKFSYEELKFLSEILLSYIEELIYSSDLDITEFPEFEFCNNLLSKLNKKFYNKNEKDVINLILRRN